MVFANDEIGGGNPVAAHELLGEDLARLKLSRCALRPEDTHAAGDQLICQTRRDDGVRANHGEVGAELGAEVRELANVLEVSRAAHGLARYPSVAGAAEDLLHRRTLANLPRQGMFAPAGTDNQYFHLRFSYGIKGRAEPRASP